MQGRHVCTRAHVEHVVCIAVSNLESIFELLLVEISSWANYKVCCTQVVLQFWLRHLGH
jgi:hypothetical protein